MDAFPIRIRNETKLSETVSKCVLFLSGSSRKRSCLRLSPHGWLLWLAECWLLIGTLKEKELSEVYSKLLRHYASGPYPVSVYFLFLFMISCEHDSQEVVLIMEVSQTVRLTQRLVSCSCR